MEQIESKRREQTEHLNIVQACDGGLTINDRTNRPAPQLTPRTVEDLNKELNIDTGSTS